MVESHHAASEINSVYQKTSTFAKSQKHDQKIQIRFNEKYDRSRQKENKLGWSSELYPLGIAFWSETSCVVGEEKRHRSFAWSL